MNLSPSSQPDVATLLTLLIQMSEASARRDEALTARMEASAARTDAILSQFLSSSPPPATNDQLVALTEMGRNMTQMSLLSIGKSRSGTSSAVSQFLTALNPLTPLFHDFDHLTKLICPGESLGVGVVSSLSLTPDLLSLSSLVNIDNFRKKTLELTYPYDDDDSALRSLSSDAIVGLATLNFATYHDKCVGILTFQPNLPSKAVTINTVSTILLCIRHIRRLAVVIFGEHIDAPLLLLQENILSTCERYSSTFIPDVIVSAINRRLARVCRAQSNSAIRLTNPEINQLLSFDYVKDADIVQDVAKLSAITLASTQESLAALTRNQLIVSGIGRAAVPTPPSRVSVDEPLPPPLEGLWPCFHWLNQYGGCKGPTCLNAKKLRPHEFDERDILLAPEFSLWVQTYRPVHRK